ncbi:ParB/RepB/Spo0J family partition protein [Candidatus Puniceispirillum sp.]|nr:ParB/RepB/Spo0J family partition protein [Candidatus Puniceispirillum sp.]
MSSNFSLNKEVPKKPAARGLGRGLSSLLGDSGVAMTATASSNLQPNSIGNPQITGFRQIPVEWINVGPWQPRRRFDKAGLEELAVSVRKNGIVQPILLRPNPENNLRFQLVAGERRWRAAQLAKTYEVPAIIRDLADSECYEIALIENIQRTDLSVIEEAQGYHKLLESNRYTQAQLSEIIGKSRSHIANILRLLLLPELVQTLLLDRKITMGQARPLIGHKQAEALAKSIVARGLSARQVEVLAKQGESKVNKLKKKPKKSSDTKALEQQAAVKLGLAVNIEWDETRECGKVTIDCRSLDQITGFLAKLGIH